MYQKGTHQVSRGGSFQRIAGARYVRTKRGWINVSSQRDERGQIIDPASICNVKDVNTFCHSLLTGQPAILYSVARAELIRYDGTHITVGVGADRMLIPLNRAFKTQKLKVRNDLIGNEPDKDGGFRLLYRTGATKTPAVRIYWNA